MIQHGTLIDTVNELELENTDIGVLNGKVAAIGRSLPVQPRTKIIDATGQYVCPGLVDLHTHVYWGSTYWGIEADPLAATTGVTVRKSGVLKLRRHPHFFFFFVL